MKAIIATVLTSLWMIAATSLVPGVAAAASGTCTASGDYGTVKESITIPATGTYYIWSRIAADSSADSSYMLQVDNSNCFTVGTSSAKTVPVYASGASTHFANDKTNWLDTTTSAGVVSVANLTAGAHTIYLIGNAPNLIIDRVILTQDSSCQPTGTGDNCAIPPDTTPPTINVTAPANNATITADTNVTVDASDNVGVTKVGFYINGTLKYTDSTSPFNYVLDPSALGSGSFQLSTIAYDAAGNSTSSSIVNFTVADTVDPSITLTDPAEGVTESGTFVANATATDNVKVSKVSFFVDNSNTPAATDTTAGTGNVFSASIDTDSLSNASHTLKAVAYDAAGNTSSASHSFTVDNSAGPGPTPPTVSVSSITSGAILDTDATTKPYTSKSFTVNATAASTNGIKQVVFQVDGATKATLTSAPYNVVLDLTGLKHGSHTLTVIATDKSTSALSTTISVPFKATYAADVNGDGTINYLDLSNLAGNWGHSGSSLGRTDINGDGVINYLDLSALAGKYGQ